MRYSLGSPADYLPSIYQVRWFPEKFARVPNMLDVICPIILPRKIVKLKENEGYAYEVLDDYHWAFILLY